MRTIDISQPLFEYILSAFSLNLGKDLGRWMMSDVKKQGFFQRLFGKKQAAEPSPKIFDYSVLSEMTAIITNGSNRAVSEMEPLAQSVAAFAEAHSDWCGEMGVNTSGERQAETLNIFAYWLTGYTATRDKTKDPAQFGAYIDWKEETEDILWGLSEADKNLGYGLNLGEIQFSGDESTDRALSAIDKFLSQKGLALTTLDTQSDCYHLFVLRGGDFERLTRLAERVGFRFTRDFS
jgi:hypothetical protein